MARPALLSGVLLTFIGPWNEFLWPFLVTKNTDMQPLAVSWPTSSATFRARSPTRPAR